MGLEYDKAQVQVLLVQDKIITDKKNEDIQKCIASPAGRITEGLNRHDPAEWRIEKINKRYDPFLRGRWHIVKTTKILIKPLLLQPIYCY